jgi:hypothetical protein
MAQFEFIIIAYSLVMALIIARGLTGVRSALMAQRRYWPHATWLFIKLLNPVVFWWVVWAYRDVGVNWNILMFLLNLTFLSIIYLQIESLVGNDPKQTKNWREHYYAERVWFFSLNALASILMIIIFSNIGFSVEPDYRGIGWSFFVVTYSIICVVTENSKVQAVIAAIALLGILAFIFTMINPTSLPG